jgi:UPF0148 protein
MPQRKEDEIMAEYLLKGGKMLEKCCTTCGCPLFEYKGTTFCVVCREREQSQNADTQPGSIPMHQKPCGYEEITPAPAPASHRPETEAIAHELSGTLLSLCHRIRNEGDPDRCLTMMDSVKIGCEALALLYQL